MTYPSIKPIDPGRDGWSVLYDTEARRLLFLCGLRADANIVRKGRPTLSWSVHSKSAVADSARTPVWDGPRHIKPTKAGVIGAMRSVMRLHGKPMAQAILHRYGATSVADLDPRWYGTVYQAAQDHMRVAAR